MPGDVSSEAHCKALVARTIAAFGKIDILVNNAAFQASHESIEEISAEEWDHTFRTNIYAYFYLAKAAAAHMPPGGSIIATSSVNAKTPSPQLLALCHHERRDCQLHGGTGAAAGGKRYPSELRWSRSGVDTADPFYHAGREGEGVR